MACRVQAPGATCARPAADASACAPGARARTAWSPRAARCAPWPRRARAAPPGRARGARRSRRARRACACARARRPARSSWRRPPPAPRASPAGQAGGLPRRTNTTPGTERCSAQSVDCQMPHKRARVFPYPGQSARSSACHSMRSTARAPHLPAQRRLVALGVGRAVRPAARRGRGAAAVGAGSRVGPRRAGRERSQARALSRAEALQLRGRLVGGRARALRRRLLPRTLLHLRAARAAFERRRRSIGALAGISIG